MASRIFTTLLVVTAIFLFSSCLQDKCDRTHEFVRYDPVYMTLDGMRVDVSVEAPRQLQSPGNIYYYNNYLLINERLEGIHVIDNTDPANPVNVSFIEIPGNRDIAVRDNILYADMFIDLVAIDITDVTNPVMQCRIENVFQDFFPNAGTLGYIVEYTPTNEVVQVDCSDWRWDSWWWRADDALWLSSSSTADVFSPAFFDAESSLQGNNSGNTGVAGSMSRFTIAKDYLYALNISSMNVFDLASSCPSQKNTVQMTWGIETLFPYGDYLFVGSQNGMLIYDNENPESPSYLSQFNHAQACDPVFVSEDIAYVTLRDGTDCQNFTNQLDVIDVSTISSPRLLKSYPMKHPHGLSVAGNTLVLCEGAHGLKVFDVEDKDAISENLLSHVEEINAFDVILVPQKALAMVIGTDGLYQFDISDRSKPNELSKIQITR